MFAAVLVWEDETVRIALPQNELLDVRSLIEETAQQILSTGSGYISLDPQRSTFVPQSADSWITKTSMPTARDYHAVGVVNNKIYVIGGSDGSGFLSTNEEYDPATDTWTSRAPMLTPRQWFAIGVIDGKIYAVGGEGAAGTLRVNEEYDPGADSWTTKAPMPTARWALAAGAVGGKLYAIGGRVTGTYLSTNEEYDPSTDSWTSKASMPTPRMALAIGALGGRLYAMGGIGTAGTLSANEAYDAQTNAWTARAPMPTPRQFLAAGVVSDRVYAIGGHSSDAGGYLSANEEYDPGTDSWSAKAPMPTPREALGVGVVGSYAYAIGGSDSSGRLAVNEEYEAIIAATNTPPVASFKVTPTSGDLGTSFRVDASNSFDAEDPLGALEVRWDWEDDGVWDAAWSLTKTAEHQYSEAGIYTIRLQVRDTGGLTNTTSQQVEVAVAAANERPIASFTFSPLQPVVGETVLFDASSSSDSEDPVEALQVRWDWEDDGTWDTPWSSEKTAKHRYAIEGVFIVRLEVADLNGGKNSTTSEVWVTTGDEGGRFVLEEFRRPEVMATVAVFAASTLLKLVEWSVRRGERPPPSPVRRAVAYGLYLVIFLSTVLFLVLVFLA
jgi:PKD repeat protein/N-acetylneuraminic acid mutarotase